MKITEARGRLVVGLFIPLMMIACKGPTGPEGPAGPQGATGPQGIQGPTGNANIISGADTVADADWSEWAVQISYATSNSGGTFGKLARYIDFSVPAYTGATFNSGAVLVWMQRDPLLTPNAYVQLPWLYNYVSGTQEYHYDPDLTPGRIRVLFFIVDLSNPSSSVSPLAPTQATRIFRWVIIPPAAVAAAATLPVDFGPEAVLRELKARGYGVTTVR